jgi:hypothetical protein
MPAISHAARFCAISGRTRPGYAHLKGELFFNATGQMVRSVTFSDFLRHSS